MRILSILGCLMVVALRAQNIIKIDQAGALLGKVRLLCGIITGETDKELTQLAQLISKDLSFSGQFEVALSCFDRVHTEKEVTQLFENGYSLVLFLNRLSEKSIEWRLYDATQAHMLKGKRSENNGGNCAWWAHLLAQDIWSVLTGGDAWFATKIVYIQKKGHHHARRSYTLCVADYDGLCVNEVIVNKRALIAPCWSGDTHNPQLIFSECTSSNVRLMGVDLEGHKRIVLDRDGTNVGVSFAPFTDDVVYCHSGQIWRYRYDKEQKKGMHSLLIKDDEVCASPVLLEGGDIIYCCGGKIKRYYVATKKYEILTPSGYCVAPAYCARTQMLAYSKRVGSRMQIFTYNMQTKEHRQLTTDSGNKCDASWSPCGNYLVFCHEKGAMSRIALEQVQTGKRIYITPESVMCSCPAWSPIYRTML